MSQPATKHHCYDDAQETELARWPGVAWSRQVRSKHYALVLTYRGVSRFVIYPTSPGDTTRGALNHLRDVRAELRALGAERTEEHRATQPRRQRNRTDSPQLVRGEEITGGPARDPWAALRGVEMQYIAAPPLSPPSPESRWQRLRRAMAAWWKAVSSGAKDR